jgi:glycosyltransferase involved in cell wall biosynthesis
MKVALVTVYPPRRDGVGDHAAKLVGALRRVGGADVEISVFSLARDGAGRTDQRAILSMDPRSWWRLRGELRTGGYDIVHLQFDIATYLLLIGPLLVILASLRATRGPKVVATYHDAYADRRLYGWLGVIFYNLFSRVFDRIYVHSRLAEICLVEQYGVPADKVRRIDLGTFEFANHDRHEDDLRRRWGLSEAPVVLNFGFIYRTKGIEVLIDAVSRLASTGEALPHVVIAGEPAVRRGIFRVFQMRNQRYLDGLRAKVHNAGLDAHVSFVGHVPDDDVFALFTLADVVVLPYLVVDQSSVLNMAIAAQTPVIASDIGGLGETLAEVGILVPPSSSADLARALRSVLSSPELRGRLRADYARIARRLSTDTVAAVTLDDYRGLCRQPCRVVQVSAYYPPHLGGQESVVEQLSQRLAGAGIDVQVITSRLPVTGKTSDAVRVRRLWACELAHTALIPGLPIALRLRARDAVVHVHTGQAFVPETVSLVCGLLRRPYIAHVHLQVRPSGRLGRLLPAYQRLIFGAVLRHAAVVVCLGETMRRYVIDEHHVAAERAVVIPNGVDEDWFVDELRTPQAGSLLFVGRLAAQKNLAVVIRAMARLPEDRLIVIGEGEERTALEALVSSLGLTNVEFLGRRSSDEVRAAMLRASVLVLPSTHEGLPLVLLEAAASGLPVVASNIPELRETGLASRLVPADDPRGWACTLRDLLSDDAALHQLSANGVRCAAEHRWDRVVSQWLDLYDRVAGAPR